jgi:hypothetical protein
MLRLAIVTVLSGMTAICQALKLFLDAIETQMYWSLMRPRFSEFCSTFRNSDGVHERLAKARRQERRTYRLLAQHYG